MKAKQQLLSQLRRQTGCFRTADSLRATPVDENKKMRTTICTLMDSQIDARASTTSTDDVCTYCDSPAWYLPVVPPAAASPAVPTAEPYPEPDAKHS